MEYRKEWREGAFEQDRAEAFAPFGGEPWCVLSRADLVDRMAGCVDGWRMRLSVTSARQARTLKRHQRRCTALMGGEVDGGRTTCVLCAGYILFVHSGSEKGEAHLNALVKNVGRCGAGHVLEQTFDEKLCRRWRQNTVISRSARNLGEEQEIQDVIGIFRIRLNAACQYFAHTVAGVGSPAGARQAAALAPGRSLVS